MADPMSEDQMVKIMTEMSKISPAQAKAYLEAAAWNLDVAVDLCLQDGSVDQGLEAEPHPSASGENEDIYSTPTSSRPTERAPTQPSRQAVPAASRAQPASNRRFATVSDFNRQESHGHDHDDDDEDEDMQQDFFAGGEKSGLAVQGPGQQRRERGLVNDILRHAAEGASQPHPEHEQAPARFSGAGQTLGSDDTPSVVVPDPHAPNPNILQPVNRSLTFWQDGFSVEDGPLMPYSDPENQAILRAIQQGRAPPSLMNVEPGQPTNVTVFKRMEENYQPPSSAKKPFRGSGNRLGSPAPSTSSAVTPAPAATSSSAATKPANVALDNSQPTISLQIRLADGTRLVSRFNPSHTVGDIYSFVTAARSDPPADSFVLMTTFPSNQLTDKAAVIGDVAELKKGGVVMQRRV